MLSVALFWLIEHDWPNPVVLMQIALFGAAAAVRGLVVFVAVPDLVACTTAQLPVVQKNVFLPPAAAI
ncbi:MAG TPA: hypothetical protein VF225_00895 [Gaiellaceae bacterium]